MSQSKKNEPGNRSAEKAPGSKIIDKAPKWNRTGFIIASVVLAIILIIVGVFYYQERVVPFQRTILTVDDSTINMDYFLKRTRLAGADPIGMLQTLTREQVIKLAAPQYVGEVSPEDIDRILRDTSNTTSESEFKAWYRQQLNENGLSDPEFKEIIGSGLLTARLHEYLVERMPTVAEQIHPHIILLETYEDAEEVRTRWEAGEDFAALAREVSLDEATKEKGGDLGWFPRGILDFQLEYEAFSLSTGNVSEPSAYYDVSDDPSSSEVIYYYLLMVSEKAAAREVSEDYLPMLKAKVLDDWYLVELQFHEISSNFNSEIYAWLNWQLAKQ
ncbi:peptidylprolyl isomerase [Chloroflexota bacterium]